MRPLEMPEEFVVEMWCDWVVAGRLQGNDMIGWLKSHLSGMVLCLKTKALIFEMSVNLIISEEAKMGEEIR